VVACYKKLAVLTLKGSGGARAGERGEWGVVESATPLLSGGDGSEANMFGTFKNREKIGVGREGQRNRAKGRKKAMWGKGGKGGRTDNLWCHKKTSVENGTGGPRD